MEKTTLLKDNMPQFSGCRIVDDPVFSGKVYDNGRSLSDPPISAPSAQVEVEIDLLTPVTPFSSGSEFDYWSHQNCDECTRSSCALRDRLELAYVDDGKIPYKTAKRIGCKLSIQRTGIFARLTTCREIEP